MANRSLWDRWTAIHIDGEFYFLVEDPPGSGEWRLPPGTAGELPLMFSLLGSRAG